MLRPARIQPAISLPIGWVGRSIRCATSGRRNENGSVTKGLTSRTPSTWVTFPGQTHPRRVAIGSTTSPGSRRRGKKCPRGRRRKVEPRILRMNELRRLTRLSKATIYRLLKSGAFPRPIRLSVRAVGWRTEEIDDWLASRERAGSMFDEIPSPSRSARRGRLATPRAVPGAGKRGNG